MGDRGCRIGQQPKRLAPGAFQALRHGDVIHNQHFHVWAEVVDMPVRRFVRAQVALQAGIQSTWATGATRVEIERG
jgi:hypothetical protein